MNYTIYYRPSLMEDTELAAAQKYFNCVPLLTDIKENDIVIPRYSLYPFVYDQMQEIKNISATCVNTYHQHIYAADLINWVLDLQELTPPTWNDITKIPDNMQFVLKGETNSKKSNWNRDMFAANKEQAIEIYGRLVDDSLIGQQKIYIRQYIPLTTYLTGIGGIPITKEFRFFVLDGEIISGAYYWQNYIDDLPKVPNVDDVPREFLQKSINRIKDCINFMVLDVAETQSGEWIVVEVNSGNQSGLSCNDPEILYRNLKNKLVSMYPDYGSK